MIPKFTHLNVSTIVVSHVKATLKELDFVPFLHAVTLVQWKEKLIPLGQNLSNMLPMDWSINILTSNYVLAGKKSYFLVGMYVIFT